MSYKNLARQYADELEIVEARLHAAERKLDRERRAMRHVIDLIADGKPSYRVHEYCLAHTSENRL